MIESYGEPNLQITRQDIQPRLDEAWQFGAAEPDEVPMYHRRRTGGIWVALATVAVALVAATAYGYCILRQENIQVAEIPRMLTFLPQLDQHIVSTANLLTSTRIDQERLEARLSKVDAGASAAIGLTRQQMGSAVQGVQQSLWSGINQSTGDLQSQISQLADQQKSDQTRLSELQTELVQARSELASAQKNYASELAGLREEQESQRTQLTSLSHSLPTRQVFFEIRRSQTADIAPGIVFRLAKTDAGHQRFDGWIEAASGHQKVSIQNQEVRSPVMFFPGELGETFLMVATRINQQTVGGYFLVPTKIVASREPHLVSAAISESPLGETSERREDGTLQQ